MGIRVDEDTLVKQLEISDCMERVKLPFQQALVNKELPYNVGGEFNQECVCSFKKGTY